MNLLESQRQGLQEEIEIRESELDSLEGELEVIEDEIYKLKGNIEIKTKLLLVIEKCQERERDDALGEEYERHNPHCGYGPPDMTRLEDV